MLVFSLLIMGGTAVDYPFNLPTTAYMTTGYNTKTAKYEQFANNVTYTGNSSYRIDFSGNTSSGR